MAALTGIDMALRKQISRTLVKTDTGRNRRSFLGLLLALDNFYQTPGTRFQKQTNTDGRKIQIDFRLAAPAWTGIDASGTAVASLPITRAATMTTAAGNALYAGYHSSEALRKADINRFRNSEMALADYVKTRADAFVDGLYVKLDADMFPATNPTQTVGDGSASKIMAVGFPLQTGGTANGTASSTYVYSEIDMNDSSSSGYDYTQLKAVSSGNGTTGFGNPTLTSLRTKLLIPLRKRGANIDLVGVDGTAFDYALQQAESKLYINQADRLVYGGQLVNYGGYNLVHFEGLDQYDDTSTKYRQIMCLDSSTWFFTTKNIEEKNFQYISDVPDAPTLELMQGYVETALVCTNPAYNGLGYKLS